MKSKPCKIFTNIIRSHTRDAIWVEFRLFQVSLAQYVYAQWAGLKPRKICLCKQGLVIMLTLVGLELPEITLN
jgi:hypothetical protein